MRFPSCIYGWTPAWTSPSCSIPNTPIFVSRTLNPDLSVIWQRQKAPFSLRSLRALSSQLWALYSTSVNVNVLVFFMTLSSFFRISESHLESSVFLFPKILLNIVEFLCPTFWTLITLNLLSPVIGCLLDGAEVRDAMIMKWVCPVYLKKHTSWITSHLV